MGVGGVLKVDFFLDGSYCSFQKELEAGWQCET